MADTRFFTRPTPRALAELAALAGATAPDSPLLIADVAPLVSATANQLSFFDNIKYKETAGKTNAGAVLCRAEHAALLPPSSIAVISPDPYKAYARIAQALYPEEKQTPLLHPSAVIDKTATIGAGTVVEPLAVIGAGVVIGENCRIGSHASISHAIIGNNTVIYPGARIGQPGFGFAFDPEKPVKVPQLGRVIIGDDVEIGANATIDRGAGPDTVIENGAMLDNMVHIAHNVRVGRGCIIAGQVGISGSTHLGAYVQIGGQAGLTGHLKIGSGAKIAAGSGVMRDVPNGGEVGGRPAQELGDWLRQTAYLRRTTAKKA